MIPYKSPPYSATKEPDNLALCFYNQSLAKEKMNKNFRINTAITAA